MSAWPDQPLWLPEHEDQRTSLPELDNGYRINGYWVSDADDAGRRSSFKGTFTRDGSGNIAGRTSDWLGLAAIEGTLGPTELNFTKIYLPGAYILAARTPIRYHYDRTKDGWVGHYTFIELRRYQGETRCQIYTPRGRPIGSFSNTDSPQNP